MDYNRFTYELQARNFPVSKSRRSPAPHQSPATHQPPPQVGRGTYRLPTGSAHADGGAAKVKRRFSLAARHRFFGQAPKKWGRIAGQANDSHPTYRRTRRKHNDKAALSFALYVCAVFLGNRPRWPCPFHPISLLLRKETGWSPKETRLWVPPRDMYGPTRLSHGLEAPTSPPTASS